jgi:hypothetical protein
MGPGNSWAQDARALVALGAAAVLFVPAAVMAFRRATR